MPQLNYEQRQRLFNYFSEAHDVTLMEDDFRMIDDLICSQNSAKLSVSGLLEFGKPKMNIAALEAKMKKFFDIVSADELIERFEKMGYEFKYEYLRANRDLKVNDEQKAELLYFADHVMHQLLNKHYVIRSADVHKLGEAILKKQFEIYSPLRKAVVEVPEIVYQFDKAGIDIVPKVDF